MTVVSTHIRCRSASAAPRSWPGSGPEHRERRCPLLVPREERGLKELMMALKRHGFRMTASVAITCMSPQWTVDVGLWSEQKCQTWSQPASCGRGTSESWTWAWARIQRSQPTSAAKLRRPSLIQPATGNQQAQGGI
ncbi:unnamed protein product [Rangifer tarandus platyrhynchus]|uniref:Uncharacterized protein n=2 Tax=Rangifer tarandus platyrhynchus TaxID=3082113 RepID=A0ABN8YTX4_RANTA|nr:unnamed protein product [Rangifer tarandus platyrhynchus]CAI9702402.1 unnamed protein product [Rangifer tarandus platyrhynchus]